MQRVRGRASLAQGAAGAMLGGHAQSHAVQGNVGLLGFPGLVRICIWGTHFFF